MYLDKLENGKGRSAVLPEHESHNAQQLGVEAAVPQAQQEAAQQSHLNTEQTTQQVKQLRQRHATSTLNRQHPRLIQTLNITQPAVT
jgi:ribosomal protein L35